MHPFIWRNCQSLLFFTWKINCKKKTNFWGRKLKVVIAKIGTSESENKIANLEEIANEEKLRILEKIAKPENCVEVKLRLVAFGKENCVVLWRSKKH